MTLGSPFLHSIPRHHRPAYPQWGDSSLPGHQPGQPGLPAHPAAGWGWARHLQQGQRNATLQRCVAAFTGMPSSCTSKAELQDNLGWGAESQWLALVFYFPVVVLYLLCLTCHAMAFYLILYRDRIAAVPQGAGCDEVLRVRGETLSGALSMGCLHDVPNLQKAGQWRTKYALLNSRTQVAVGCASTVTVDMPVIHILWGSGQAVCYGRVIKL